MIIENQQKAIFSRNNNILLSASAGTGKTYTMVARILSLLQEGEDISSFLVLAFGNDASKEMKDRIEQGIANLAKSDNKYHAQLKKLKIASISTIHSFALEIAKTYFAVSGASPKAQVLLGAEEDVLKATAMEKVFLDEYENPTEDFLSLVEYFIQNRKDDGLKRHVARLYTFSRNMPKGEFKQSFFESLDNNTLQTAYMQNAKEVAKSYLENYLAPYPVLEIYQNQYNQLVAILNGIISATTPKEMLDVASVEYARKTSVKKSDAESVKIACDSFYLLIRDKIKKFTQKLQEELTQGLESEDFKTQYRKIAKSLFWLTEKFQEEYKTLKAQKDYVDFSDTEHMLLAVLRDEKSRGELQERYKFIFCDEYQDVSKIQEEILTLISAKGNLFTVGDIKQNIYGFRACDQSVIKNRENAIKNGGNGLLLPMNTNFRSHKDILQFTNCVFSACMKNPAICEYEKTSMFECMADFPDLEGVEIAISKKIPPKETPRKEVYSVMEDKGGAREEPNAQNEGKHIIKFIKRYLGTQFDFAGGRREVKLSDFTILLRKTTGEFAKTISAMLESNNLPNYILSSESNLKTHTKVLFLADFLKTIASPFDDVPLYSTLVSPFFEIPDSVLFEIRKENQKGYFHESFFGYAKTVAEKYDLPQYPFSISSPSETEDNPQNPQQKDIFSVDFSKVLKTPTATPQELAVAKFLCGHKKYRTISLVSCHEMLKTAIADNRVKEKIILAYGEAEWSFAVEFLKFLASLADVSLSHACEKLEKAMETIKFSASGTVANAVAIMTMHKSKGLEFPFTIIAGTGGMYNDTDTKSTILFHKDYGIAFAKRDLETRKNSNTFEKIALKNIMAKDVCNEELRLLYVALTRGKYKLLITGTLNYDFHIQDNAVVAEKLPILTCPQDFYSLNSHLKVILASLSASEYQCNHTITRILESDEISPTERIDFQTDDQNSKILAGKLLKLEQAEKTFPVIPSKFTATQRLESFSKKVEEADLQTLEKYEVGKIIDFATNKGEQAQQLQRELIKEEGISPQHSKTAIGTSYHKILEEVEFFQTTEEIAKFVENMKECEEILDIEYDIQKIHNLTNNKIFEGCTPHREVPFVMNMPSELFGEPNGREVLCQGVIDCVFQKPNGNLILLDYKATSIKSHKKLAEKYYKQLETYKMACEKILSKQVELCYIYSIFQEELIKVDC